jgi:IclR family pca regulon transcriptional regulator
MGRVLLGALPPHELEARLAKLEISRNTAHTVPDVAQLRERILQAHKQGWCLINQELEDGLVSLAAPITDRSGQVIAALNLGAQVNRMPPEQLLERGLPKLLAAAQTISGLLALKS